MTVDLPAAGSCGWEHGEVDVEVKIREVQLPQDASGLRSIDTSYVSDVEFCVSRAGDALNFAPRQLAEARRHGSADALLGELDRADRPWSTGYVAELTSGELVGFVAVGFEQWNRRLRVWHLYVSPEHRRRGIARALFSAVMALARDRGASHVFLETSSVNAPAIAAYQRLGLEIVGFDSSLYDTTPAQGEVAVYLAKRLDHSS